MTTATMTTAQGVSRYPIGLALDAPTRRWHCEILVPGADVAPDGRRLDGTVQLIVGDIESIPGYPLPGECDLAWSLAWALARPMGFEVLKVWPDGGCDPALYPQQEF